MVAGSLLGRRATGARGGNVAGFPGVARGVARGAQTGQIRSRPYAVSNGVPIPLLMTDSRIRYRDCGTSRMYRLMRPAGIEPARIHAGCGYACTTGAPSERSTALTGSNRLLSPSQTMEVAP